MNQTPFEGPSHSDVVPRKGLSETTKDRIFFVVLGIFVVSLAALVVIALREEKQNRKAVAEAIARIDAVFGDLATACDERVKFAEQLDDTGRRVRHFVVWQGSQRPAGDVLVLMREDINSRLLPYAFDRIPNYLMPQSTQHVSVIVVIEKGYRVYKHRKYSTDALGLGRVASDYICEFAIVQFKWPEMAMMRSVVVKGPPPISGAMRTDEFGNEPWDETAKFLAPIIEAQTKTKQQN